MVAVLHVRFYRSASGVESVRKWLADTGRPTKTIIGTDIKDSTDRVALGMPLVRKMESDYGKCEAMFQKALPACFSPSMAV